MSCADQLAFLMTYREEVMKLYYPRTTERRQKRILAIARQMFREGNLEVARVLFWINGGVGEPTGHDLMEIAADSEKHTPVARSA